MYPFNKHGDNKCFRCGSSRGYERCFDCNMNICNNCISRCNICKLPVCVFGKCQDKHKIKGYCSVCKRAIEQNDKDYKCEKCLEEICLRCKFFCAEGTWCNNCKCPHIITCDCGEKSECSNYRYNTCDICSETSCHITTNSLYCCSAGGNKSITYFEFCCKDTCRKEVPKYNTNCLKSCILCEDAYCDKHEFLLHPKSEVLLCKKYCYHKYYKL